jgi:hypothetical protein
MNWLAVVVAVVAVFVLSSTYYSVVGHEAGDGSRPAPWQVAVELGRGALVTIALAVLVSRLDLGLGGGLLLGLALWVAFPFVLLSGSVVWDRVAVRVAATHAGDWLLKLLVIAAIVSAWR